MREMKREQGINDLIQPGGERKRCAVTLALVAELAVRLSADPSCAPNPSPYLAPECACLWQGCCKIGSTRQSNRGQGDGKRLHLELRGAAHDWRGARRPLRASAPVRRWPGAVRAGVGGLRACAECWLADRRARSAGVRVGTGDAAGADAVERGIPS